VCPCPYPRRAERRRLLDDTADGSGEAAPVKVDCGIIVVTYNSAGHIGKLLEGLPAATPGLRIRCLVVDNNSHDETVSILRSRDDVTVVEAGANLGYAGAINMGRSLIGPCSATLILNPDLLLESGAVVELYRALGQANVGVAVPMLLNLGGELYPSIRREPSLTRAFGDAVFGAHWASKPGWLSETVRDRCAYQAAHHVAWAGGAALLIAEDCDDAVGEWDEERFFLYSEETDFAVRARRQGYRICYVPTARAYHEDGGSGRSPALAALMAVNRVRYYEKYHGRLASALFRAVVALHYALRSARPEQRMVLRTVARRSLWSRLPHGDRRSTPQATQHETPART